MDRNDGYPEREDNPIGERCDNELPVSSGAESKNHIDRFFGIVGDASDVPCSHAPAEPSKPVSPEQGSNGGASSPSGAGGAEPATREFPVSGPAAPEGPGPGGPDGGTTGAGKKKKKLIPVIAVVLLLAAVGAALYFGLPKLMAGKSSEDRHSVPSSEPDSVEETTLQPVITTAKPVETTTEKPEETTADPDLKYTPGTYYVNIGSGTPLYETPSIYAVVLDFVPQGTKVAVTEVQVGRGFDSGKPNFGKVTYRSQTGWIKMDYTAKTQTGSSAKEIDYDAVLRCNDSYWKDYTNENVLTAYAAEVRRLREDYGSARIGKTKENPQELCGLFIVRLIDLDRDGRPELYCAYAREGESEQAKRQAIYRYAGNGTAEQLYEGPYTARGSDYSPFVWFKENNGELYFVAGDGPGRYYYSLEDDVFVGIEFAGWAGTAINDKSVSAEEYEKTIAKYEKGATDYVISIYGSTDDAHAAYIRDVLSETAKVTALLSPYEKEVEEEPGQPDETDEPPREPEEGYEPWVYDDSPWDEFNDMDE